MAGRSLRRFTNGRFTRRGWGSHAERLNGSPTHLNRNYIEQRQDRRLPGAGRPPRPPRLFPLARPDGPRARQADARRHDLPHLFDDEADHLGRADDALRARLFPAERSGAPLRAGVARPARLGVRRRRHMQTEPPSGRSACATCCATPAAHLRRVLALGAPASGHPVDKVYAELGVRRGAARRSRTSRQARPACRCAISRASAGCIRSPPTSAARWSRSSPASARQYSQDDDLRSARDEGHRLLRGRRTRSTASRANYRRGPDKKLELIDDPEKSVYREEPTFLLRRRRLTGTTATTCASARCCAAAASSTARASWAAHDRDDAPQSPEGRPGPDADGDRRLLGDRQRRRRLRARLRRRSIRSPADRWAPATTTGAVPPRPSSGSTRRRTSSSSS